MTPATFSKTCNGPKTKPRGEGCPLLALGVATGGPSVQRFPEKQREPRVALGSLESSGHFQVCEGAGVLFVVPPRGNLRFAAVGVCFSSQFGAEPPPCSARGCGAGGARLSLAKAGVTSSPFCTLLVPAPCCCFTSHLLKIE